MALALQLASSVDYWAPVAAVAIWLVIWRVKFTIMENVAGLVGLCLIGFAVAVSSARTGRARREVTLGLSTGTAKVSTYWFYAVALFGAAMTPYEVFFFSFGAVEEGWTVKDLAESRANVLVGFHFRTSASVLSVGASAESRRAASKSAACSTKAVSSEARDRPCSLISCSACSLSSSKVATTQAVSHSTGGNPPPRLSDQIQVMLESSPLGGHPCGR